MLRTTVTTTFAALMAAGAAMAQDDPPRIGYIMKMGDHPWFVAEVEGARAAAEELGAELLSQDVQFDANLAITTLDTMIGDGVDGIAIVVPDKALGPVVAARAQEAGIPLIAVDDDITFEDGAPVPYVGMDALSIGQAAGRRLAEIYTAEGWAEHNVRVASIEDAKADTCMRRNQGAEEAFLAGVPEFDPANIIRVPYDNTMVNAIDAMTTTLTANPDVTHWVFYSCNDDGVLGAARALENAGYAADQGLGVGIGGNLACEAFANGNPSGFRATLWLNPANHGRDAVSLLIDNIQNGTPIPMTTFTSPEYIDAENFESFREKLCG